MNRLIKFLLTVVGVNDPAVFDPAVPRDALHRSATIGLAMLVTTLFACVAATASALMILHDHPLRFVLAPGFGLLWAVAIFALDRALVLSMEKIRWPALVVRLVLAVTVSVSISAPLDIALFSDRVEAQLLKSRQEAELDSQARLSKLHGLESAREQTANALNELQRLDQASQSWPPQVLDAQQQAKRCEASFERQRARIQRQLAELNAKRADVQHRLNLLVGVNPRPIERIGALTQQRIALSDQHHRLEGDISEARKACDALQASAQAAQRQHLEQIQAQQKDARTELEQTSKNERQLIQTVTRKSDEAAQVISRSMRENFVAKAEALHQLVAENPFVRSVYVLVLALWITMEMAPVVAKTMAGTSALDLVLEAKSRALELAHMDRLDQQEDQLLTQRMVREALREHVPAFARENTDALRATFDERMTAQRVMTAHHELLDQLKELLERTQMQRDQIKHAGVSKDTRRDLINAVSALERAAAGSIHSAFSAVSEPPAAS